jgi:prophage regulatory protein
MPRLFEVTKMSKKLINRAGLKEKGIKWSRQHVDRKVRLGEFPKPVKLGHNTSVWLEDELDGWIEERAAARDSAL